MKPSEIKELIISSLDEGADPKEIASRLELEADGYDFSPGFKSKVLERITAAGTTVSREIDFLRNLNFAFRSIAISGVAAIILLLISIFFMEGSLSVNSFLGLKDNYDESIVCLLMGK
jgi:hypothetical protein